jgi:hypothetical protein
VQMTALGWSGGHTLGVIVRMLATCSSAMAGEGRPFARPHAPRGIRRQRQKSLNRLGDSSV